MAYALPLYSRTLRDRTLASVRGHHPNATGHTMRSAATSSRTFSPLSAYSKIPISATVYLQFHDPSLFPYSRLLCGGSRSSHCLSAFKRTRLAYFPEVVRCPHMAWIPQADFHHWACARKYRPLEGFKVVAIVADQCLNDPQL